MKKTRTVLSQEDREEVIGRDGSNCVVCGNEGQDFDHAFPLGNHGKRDKEILNQAWNINILCRRHHDNITHRLSLDDMQLRIDLMQKSLHRAYDLFEQEVYGKYYQEYKQRVARLKWKRKET